MWQMLEGDCKEVLQGLKHDSIEACITDPPYGLKFMGKDWDHGVPGKAYWTEVFRVLKPGGWLLAFGGPRTHHRLMVAIEDAGFELRDCLMWLYGCLSDDTEILVDGKWEPYHKATQGGLTLCYDKEQDEYSWQPIENLFVYDYDDIAYRISSDSTDQLVSRNHRCLVERSGAYVYEFAEEIARECEARVPVLEGLHDLLCSLSVPDKRAGSSQQNMFQGMCGAGDKGASPAPENRQTECQVCGVRQDVSPACLAPSKSQHSCLLKKMQRSHSGSSLEGTCSQRPGSLEGRIRTGLEGTNDRRDEPGLEGRGDLSETQRKLRHGEVHSLPSRIQEHGPQGWLCDGTPPDSSSSSGTSAGPTRSRSSRGPRPDKQCSREPCPVFEQPQSQTVRGSRYTRADLARVTPIHYQGKVWCVQVPTGAFVARRNGKIFVTGNSGFPKALNISKAIDKTAGAERKVIGQGPYARRSIPRANKTTQGFVFADDSYIRPPGQPITAPATPEAKLWDGWASALKPAYEPIILAMKPLDGTFAHNALTHGVAGLNVDGCRVATNDDLNGGLYRRHDNVGDREKTAHLSGLKNQLPGQYQQPQGRWPANVILDEEAGAMLDEQSGGASRFFYCAKASRSERTAGNTITNQHPTVKPLALMRWLCRLVSTPTGGTILDPFAGSGSTGVAALQEGLSFIGIEKEMKYIEIAEKRLGLESKEEREEVNNEKEELDSLDDLLG